MSEHREPRRVLVLFVGAIDAATLGRRRALRNLLAASNVELFAISFASRVSNRTGTVAYAFSQGFVRDLAEATAGAAFLTAEHGDHPEDIGRRIQRQVATFYTFGYVSGTSADRPAELVIECLRPGARVRHHPRVIGS